MKAKQQNYKKIFRELGTCSRSLFYILNREFDHPMDIEECAANPLAGGIMRKGYQCGMLWGASMAIGAESFRRNDNRDLAIGVAIKATQQVMESFVKRTNSIDCLDVTSCDWSSKLSIAKYFITGKFLSCFNLIEKWAPEAIQSAIDGLSCEQTDLPQRPISCASEVARRMNASDEEIVIVAGLAGGLGLSGNACGALSAAVWLNTLRWCRENPGKSKFSNNPSAEKTLEVFHNAADYKFLCNKITGQNFRSINDHTEFVYQGGCEKLIKALAQS